ncbi:dnaJ homolog subfamily C member 9 [Lingula anatina]|uniref:DnaJ homolog subfamily C member 9 n=1 Tax=Lingula anatina TaxID=7574 RepID=A0A1S3HGM6_LINAN|nr:dnaJ homolog subfamily C member 9 [Lingula anatina]|eukprot:XP_013385220.1 dnaJ homolog subfamily C member 9 [Lingula anatina]
MLMGLLDECQELFGSSDLYEVLGLTKASSASEVKRGYHKLSLQVHPDRVKPREKTLATKKFQALGKVYSILSDKEKRAVYDETGEVDDENDISQDRDWYDYWRLLFAKISVSDIKQFEENYKESEEELNDLKAAYVDYEGDMDEIIDSVLCASVEDEPRFRNILTELIKRKELPSFKKFAKESRAKKDARKRKAQAEAQEAEELASELGLDKNNSLQALIKKNQQSREEQMGGFLASLEAKYAQPKSKTSKGKKGK